MLFAFGSAELTTEAREQLAGVVDRIRAAKASRVVIEGHTDAVGDDSTNQRLSERRAEAVRAHLAGQIPGLALEAGGFGETRPVAPNELADGSDNPSGRHQNRRVTVILVPCRPTSSRRRRPGATSALRGRSRRRGPPVGPSPGVGSCASYGRRQPGAGPGRGGGLPGRAPPRPALASYLEGRRRLLEPGGAQHARDGSRAQAALAPIREPIFQSARRAARHDSAEAYGADALAELVRRSVGADDAARVAARGADAAEGDGSQPSGDDWAAGERLGLPRLNSSRRPDTKVIVVIDHEALERGWPRSTSAARSPAWARCRWPPPARSADAFGAAVVTNGVDVFSVAHLGRSADGPPVQCLEARGYRCEVPGCGATRGLEIDHIHDWHSTFQTELPSCAGSVGATTSTRPTGAGD